jgi:hypothetical protein
MKTKKYCLILAAVIGILYIPVLGQLEPPLPEPEPLLIGQANPAMVGIDNLHVTIIHIGEEPNELALEKLKEEINKRLSQAGIKVFSPEPGVMYKLPIWPELKICVCLLKIEQSQQYVFHIQTLLAKSTYVKVEPALQQKTDVWKTEPVMQAVSAQNMSSKVTEVVLEQVDDFIGAWRAANPKGVQHAGTNQVVINERKSAQPSTTEATKYPYVASKNSKVFHKSTCTWAKRIAPENLVHYKTREEAINDGKRPCKTCEP